MEFASVLVGAAMPNTVQSKINLIPLKGPMTKMPQESALTSSGAAAMPQQYQAAKIDLKAVGPQLRDDTEECHVKVAGQNAGGEPDQVLSE